MFTSYDLSFDSIIQQEITSFKLQLLEEGRKKDAHLHAKEKELDRAIGKAQEIQKMLEDKDHKISALLAQRKAQEIRFTVFRNLIDNLIFDYKQKILKIYGKNRDQRLMARDLIYELKELKRFSEKDNKDFDEDIENEEEDGQRAYESLKKKFNKCTQTVSYFSKKQPDKKKSKKEVRKMASQ